MKFAIKSALLLVLATSPLLGWAQVPAWPSKPIKTVVPFPPGSVTDVLARLVGEQLSNELGQPFIVDNRPGGNGIVGSVFVANAPADGYTILVHTNSHTIMPATHRRLDYDPVKDFIGVMPLASIPLAWVTSPANGIRSLADLVRKAKQNPGSINYASAGTGGSAHLAAERMRIAGGFLATQIPYKGSVEALTDVMAGRVDYFSSPVPLALPLLKSGKLVALATTGSKRTSALPDVPTSIESGLANSDYELWAGMFAPARTPRPIVDRLNESTAKVLRSPEGVKKYNSLVMDTMIMSVDEFAAFLKKDFLLMAELVKAAGIQPQ